jgi:hypothetical protein
MCKQGRAISEKAFVAGTSAPFALSRRPTRDAVCADNESQDDDM